MNNQEQRQDVEVPDWVTETPEDEDLEWPYVLLMQDTSGTWEQGIELSREEFIELKRHLAAIRGYTAPVAA